MIGVIFDSNVFDGLVDGRMDLTLIAKSKERGYSYFITSLQSDEIANIPDSKRDKRKMMILFLILVKPDVLPIETFVFNHSRLDFGKLGNAEVYSKLLKSDNSNINDALIGETAFNNKYILVSEDKELIKNFIKLGGDGKTITEFVKLIKG